MTLAAFAVLVLGSFEECKLAPGPALAALEGAVVAGHQRTVLQLDATGVLEVFDATTLKRLLRCDSFGAWEHLYASRGELVALTRGTDVQLLKGYFAQREYLENKGTESQGWAIDGAWFDRESTKLFSVSGKGRQGNVSDLVKLSFKNTGPANLDTEWVAGHESGAWAGVRTKDRKLLLLLDRGTRLEWADLRELPISGRACFAWRAGTLVAGEAGAAPSLMKFPELGAPVALGAVGPCTRSALDSSGQKLFVQNGSRISVWSVADPTAPKQLVAALECPKAVEAPDFTFALCATPKGIARVELVEGAAPTPAAKKATGSKRR